MTSQMNYQLKDVEENNIASEFAVKHYDDLMRMGVASGLTEDSAMEAVQDLIVSLLKSEKQGNGYSRSIKNEEGLPYSVANFVYGRFSKYKKNIKYRRDICESSGNHEVLIIDASSTGSENEDESNLNGFQEAYNNAASFDAIEVIEEQMSIKENIEYVMEFEERFGFKVKNFLMNYDKLKTMNLDKSLFAEFKKVLDENPDVQEALLSIVNFMRNHRNEFEAVLATC